MGGGGTLNPSEGIWYLPLYLGQVKKFINFSKNESIYSRESFLERSWRD